MMTQEWLTRFTSIGRPLDITYPSNVLIMVFTVLAGIIAGLLTLTQGGALLDAVQSGIWMGGAVFLAWALAREVDPDHAASAFVAAVLAFAGMLLLNVPQPYLLSLVVLLIAVRVVNRSVGPPAKQTDSLVLLLGIAAVMFIDLWAIGAVLVVAFALDAILPHAENNQRYFAVAGAGLVIGFLVVNGFIGERLLTGQWFIGMTIATVAFLVYIALMEVFSDPDVNGYALHERRVKAGAFLLWLVTFVGSMWGGAPAANGLLAAWTVLLGVPFYHLGRQILPASLTQSLETRLTRPFDHDHEREPAT